ncbi:MAG: class D sortase [Enterococcus sp.]
MKRIGAIIFAPIVFLIIGYSLIYVIGQPVIQFVTSSLDLFLLNDAPKFDETSETAFAAVKDEDVKTDADNELPSSEINYPRGGEKYGKIVIDDLKIDEPLYFGDTQAILRYGAGQYMGSVYPGELGTTLVGGHNTASFGKLLGIETGTTVKVQTTYANYTYKVVSREIKYKTDQDIQAQIVQQKKRHLILYTCYPLNSLGMSDRRVFVTCEFVDGPIINDAK